MSEKLISRRGAFSLLGLGAALGFVVPTTALMTSDAEAQTSPAYPTTPAPSAPAPTATAPVAPATGMERRQERRSARRSGREMRREARRTARTQRREARRGMYMQSNKPIKQPQ
jgi:hypothetical protein